MFDYMDELTVSPGDVLDYILTTNLSEKSGKKGRIRKCVISDQLQPAVKYNDDVKIAVYRDEAAALENDLAKASALWDSKKYYKARICRSWFRKKEPELKIKVRRTGLNEINAKYRDCYLVAYYTGTVKENMGYESNPKDGAINISRKPAVLWISAGIVLGIAAALMYHKKGE